METTLKIGDKVYEGIRFRSWGVIEEISINNSYPIKVRFTNYNTCYNFLLDGSYTHNEPPTLSFTEYNLTTGGFSQERPEILPEKGDIVWVRDVQDGIWRIVHFVQKLTAGPYYFECSDYANLVDRDTYKFMTTKNPFKNESN